MRFVFDLFMYLMLISSFLLTVWFIFHLIFFLLKRKLKRERV